MKTLHASNVVQFACCQNDVRRDLEDGSKNREIRGQVRSCCPNIAKRRIELTDAVTETVLSGKHKETDEKYVGQKSTGCAN